MASSELRKMTTISKYLENMIEKCGGYGKYQLLLTIILISSKISVTWTMLMMSFAGAKPDWWCVSQSEYRNYSKLKQCTTNTSVCAAYKFDDSMDTVINEWDLICGKSWVSAAITTIQMGGVLVGGMLCGQMGDYFGRKPTFFLSILFITASNTIAFFSVSWQMFAVLRFFMGISCGMILTVYLVLLYEFITVQKRAIMSGIPSWAIFASLFAFFAWLIRDWKYLHLVTAATAAPLLLTWWIVPESFRWLIAHHRVEEAKQVIRKMARMNGVPEPDLSDLEKLREMNEATKRYTFTDIFKGRDLIKNTICLAFMWMTCGYVYYAISFSVQNLSGDLYLNMFLLSAVAIPSNVLTICCNNRIGRKWTVLGFFLICALASLGVAIVQVLEVGDIKGELINGFALISKLCCGSGWVSLTVLSAEVYPTVVRNLGYGFHNTAARVGAMVAPQIIFLSDIYPGLLYFLCSALMVGSVVCAFLSTETRGQQLQDTLHVKSKSIFPEKREYEAEKTHESTTI